MTAAQMMVALSAVCVLLASAVQARAQQDALCPIGQRIYESEGFQLVFKRPSELPLSDRSATEKHFELRHPKVTATVTGVFWWSMGFSQPHTRLRSCNRPDMQENAGECRDVHLGVVYALDAALTEPGYGTAETAPMLLVPGLRRFFYYNWFDIFEVSAPFELPRDVLSFAECQSLDR